MQTLGNCFTWIKLNIKLVLLSLATILLLIFIALFASKNKKIRSLQAQLAVTNAQLQISKIELKYNTTMAELKDLKEKDVDISNKITDIETSLKSKLEGQMTAEEIAEEFRKLGL